jgi:colanic acid biosynthesis glycosyl transferase WcaI
LRVRRKVRNGAVVQGLRVAAPGTRTAGLTRVVLLNRFFFPDHSATSQLATDLAVCLSARGFDVLAITSRQRYDDPSAQLARNEMNRGVQIRRVGATEFGRRNLVGRSVDYLSFYVSACFRLWREIDCGAVTISLTDPPLLGVPALLVVRLRGAHGVNWLQDVFPEVAERLNLLRPRALASVLRVLRNWSLRHAHATVVIGERMAAQVTPWCAAPPVLIPNWALVEGPETNEPSTLGEATAAQALRAVWGLGNAFVVGYSGNMGRAHRLDGLIDAALGLRSLTSLRFLMIGDGAQRAALEARARSLDLQNMMFQPYQPLERLRESLSLPDIQVVTLDERLEGLIVPSKFVGVLAMGRPVLWIGAAEGEVGRLVREFGCGVTVPPGDTVKLTRVLSDLSDDHARGGERLRAMAQAAQALWCGQFRRRAALDAWVAVIEGCAQGGRGNESSRG